jgi:hypothetical protein
MRFAALLAVALFASAPLSSARADDPETALLEAIVKERATQRAEYKYVRSAVAKYFEDKHAADIKAAFGDDHKAITGWLAANAEVRDLLYTAIDPKVDDAKAALAVFRDLYKLGPDKLKAHPQLAVAAAVVWDQPKAVYDYRGHQVRTKSVLPDSVMSTAFADNYEQLIADEKTLKGPVQQLPWEFLVHVVNHRTPKDERAWAVKSYLKRRPGVGAIYQDVQYDVGMLKTKSEVCKLNGQPYTLPSLLKHGGVCAMQADFAARVAKSLSVPAEYVGGEANSGGLHAWVMWAEVKTVRADGGVDFAMMTEGQYQEDRYYIGTLKDPKTGQPTTDRDVARRLSTVATNPQNARQADLLMRVYPALLKSKEWKADQQRKYLDAVLLVFPYAERVWLEYAAMAKDGRLTNADTANALAVKAFDSFAKHPDFSWQLLPDLIRPITSKPQRMKLYERAVTAYEALGRPDLACEARLTLAKLQEEAKEYKKAADGLAQTVRKFPDEGRYVPKIMTELADVCGKFDGGTDLLAKFYLDILPKVPKTRGTEVSEYCLKLHEQAFDFFTANKKPKEAEAVRKQLDPLKKAKASGG